MRGLPYIHGQTRHTKISVFRLTHACLTFVKHIYLHVHYLKGGSGKAERTAVDYTIIET